MLLVGLYGFGLVLAGLWG